MPYIGKAPVSGGFHKLDSLTASATATYALTLNSAAYYPETANQLLVSLNGVIQAPQDSFTVSGSNLVFDSALTASDSIDFVVALGDVLGVGSVSDGAITTAKIANQAVTMDKLATSGTLPALDGSALTGINAGSEYFQVNLTTDQTGISSQSGVYVDFGAKGTVEHDTASNFDSSNDCYLLDSSNGVYIISYSLGIRSPTITTEILVCASAAINIATDGSTYSPYKGNAMQIRGDAGNDGGSVTLANSFIYKATTATTKIKLAANATTVGSANWMIETQAGSMMQDTDSAVTAAHVTFMSVMRIA